MSNQSVLVPMSCMTTQLILFHLSPDGGWVLRLSTVINILSYLSQYTWNIKQGRLWDLSNISIVQVTYAVHLTRDLKKASQER